MQANSIYFSSKIYIVGQDEFQERQAEAGPWKKQEIVHWGPANSLDKHVAHMQRKALTRESKTCTIAGLTDTHNAVDFFHYDGTELEKYPYEKKDITPIKTLCQTDARKMTSRPLRGLLTGGKSANEVSLRGKHKLLMNGSLLALGEILQGFRAAKVKGENISWLWGTDKDKNVDKSAFYTVDGNKWVINFNEAGKDWLSLSELINGLEMFKISKGDKLFIGNTEIKNPPINHHSIMDIFR